jgi:hypothetical protein
LAAQIAAERGDGRPAETILRHLPVPGPHGTSRRLLEPKPKPAPSGSREAQIVIGNRVVWTITDR